MLSIIKCRHLWAVKRETPAVSRCLLSAPPVPSAVLAGTAGQGPAVGEHLVPLLCVLGLSCFHLCAVSSERIYSLGLVKPTCSPKVWAGARSGHESEVSPNYLSVWPHASGLQPEEGNVWSINSSSELGADTSILLDWGINLDILTLIVFFLFL